MIEIKNESPTPGFLTVDQAFQQAVNHHQNGNLQEAERLYRAILNIIPKHPDANHNLGVLAVQAKQPAVALPHLKIAMEENPKQKQFWFSYIDTLISTGRYESASEVLEQGCKQGLHGEAIDHLKKRLASSLPDDIPGPNPDCNVLLSLFKQGRYQEVETLARQMTERSPDEGFGWKALGSVLKILERADEALIPLMKATELIHGDAEAFYNLASTFYELGRMEDAEAGYRKALQIKPDYANAHCNLGNVLSVAGRFAEAEASYQKTLQIMPDYADAHNNLGVLYSDLRRFADAETRFQQAIALRPDYAEAYNNLGNALKDLGRLNEAETSYQMALKIMPGYANAFSNLLFVYNYTASHYLSHFLEDAKAWELNCIPDAIRVAAHNHKFICARPECRRLRIGYISNDCRQHAVSYFIKQLFAYHDASQFEIFVFSTNARRDEVTEKIASLVEHWVPAAGFSDDQLHKLILNLNIDVLIDLSGHTAHNRLGVFARRAAPVQAHWLGYFATTGLTEMDYWIGDSIITPPDTDHQFCESVWRLPRVWISYDGNTEAPDSQWRPSKDGTIWLGSYNNLGKLTTATLDLWAVLLHELPEAKLLLKTKELAEAANRQRIYESFARHGINVNRIELKDWSATPDWRSHMAYYDRLDIALDPICSVGGGTTTCDALWMGVPVVTLVGDRMASRMSAAMLDAIGRPEWLAKSNEEYISKAVELAYDVKGRALMRASQRVRMASSPLCDAKGLAGALENAYEAMFCQWWEKQRHGEQP